MIPQGVSSCRYCRFGRPAPRAGPLRRFMFRRTNRLGTVVSLVIGMIASILGGFVSFMLFCAGADGEDFNPDPFGWAIFGCVAAAILIALNLTRVSDGDADA